jgi:hypothetical protein
MPRLWRLDYGPEFEAKGLIANEPPKLGALYTVLVPQTDPDGTDLGGIRIPEVAVPLGTFTGWNYQLPLLDNLDYLAGLVGSFIPFEATAEARKASGDTRLSIAERYASREQYLERIEAAARRLVARRLLLNEDVKAVVAEDAARWDYLTGNRTR